MPLDPHILDRIQEEIKTDPSGMGYAGNTADEIAKLLNTPRVTKTPIIFHDPPPPPKDGDIIGETVVQEDARTAVILLGVPNAPNAVTPQDIEPILTASSASATPIS